MVIDINILRKDRGGDPEIVLKSEKNRFRDLSRVEKILSVDQKLRESSYRIDELRKRKNVCSKLFSTKMKESNNNPSENGECPIEADPLLITTQALESFKISELKTCSKSIDEHIIANEASCKALKEERDELLSEVGNILHPSVPISNDESENRVERMVGNCSIEKPLSHVDLLLMIDGADYRRGVSIAGNRCYYLKGPGVFLAQALVQYSLRILYEDGYQALYTPFFMKKDVMKQVAQLSQFDDELYTVTTKNDPAEEGQDEEKYLIATSEQTIAAFHKDEWMDPGALPIKYAGVSTCFRREVGSHGRDTTGIFRVHQFEKVEQFIICSPLNNESWDHLENMIKNSEKLCQDLGFSYRVVSIVSGALNNAAAKKYDVEAWFPASKAFRELVSCSNCTDYQSRSLAIRYGRTKQKNKEVEFVHMLNCTMCAITRYLCCLLETHQTADGIEIPECLHPYLPKDLQFIPFSKKLADVRKSIE